MVIGIVVGFSHCYIKHNLSLLNLAADSWQIG